MDARRRQLFLSKTITKTQIAVRAVLACFFVIMAARGRLGTLTIGIGVLLLALILITAAIYFVQPGLVFDQTSKYHAEYRLEFYKERIVFETQGIRSELKWDMYTGYMENERYFYLLQGKYNFFVLPKRVFLSGEEEDEFRALLGECVKGKR